MTLALIALIVFLCLWAAQVGEKKEQEDKYKERTKTNVALERELMKAWSDKLSPELDVVKPEFESVYDYIRTLYEKYNIPVFHYLGASEEREKFFNASKRESDNEEKEAERTRLNCYSICAYYSYEKYKQQKETKALPFLTPGQPRTEYFLALGEEEVKRRHQHYLTCAKHLEKDTPSPFSTPHEISKMVESKWYQEGKLRRFYDAFGEDCPPLPNTPPPELYTKNRTIRQRIYELEVEGIETETFKRYSGRFKVGMCNQKADYFYSELLHMLTVRDLKSRGYSPSPDGIHESEWQEREKRQKEIEEEKKKYPWLYK